MRERAQKLLGGARAPLPSSGRSTPGALRLLRRLRRARRTCRRASRSPTPPTSCALVKEAMAELADLRPGPAARRRARAGSRRPRTRSSPRERFERDADRTSRASGSRRSTVLYEKKLAAAGRARLRRPDRAARCASCATAGHPRPAERRRVRHLLIDEYQDTNTLAGRARQAPRRGRDSLCAVGDEDQAIYRWRGAEVEHILRFDEDFPGARVVPLETQLPLDRRGSSRAASGVVANNRRRREEAPARRPRAGGAACACARFEEDRQETEAVARAIAEVGTAAGRRRDPLPDQRAVAALRRGAACGGGFPYVVVGGMKFYERAEVKDALAYLRLAARPEDDLAFRRVVNVPARGIGAATLDRIAAAARETGRSWWEVSASLRRASAERARVGPRRAFRALVEDLREKAQTYSPSRPARAPASRRPATPRSTRAPRTARTWRGGRTSRSSCQLGARVRAAQRGGRDGRRVPRHGLARDRRRRPSRPAAARVTLSTLHAAKGLEFPAGLRRRARGGLPAARRVARRTRTELEEERRLLYVGMTRAEDELTLDARRPAAGLRHASSTAAPRASSRRSRSATPRGARTSAAARPPDDLRARSPRTSRHQPLAAAAACATRATATASSSREEGSATRPA